MRNTLSKFDSTSCTQQSRTIQRQSLNALPTSSLNPRVQLTDECSRAWPVIRSFRLTHREGVQDGSTSNVRRGESRHQKLRVVSAAFTSSLRHLPRSGAIASL